MAELAAAMSVPGAFANLKISCPCCAPLQLDDDDDYVPDAAILAVAQRATTDAAVLARRAFLQEQHARRAPAELRATFAAWKAIFSAVVAAICLVGWPQPMNYVEADPRRLRG